MRTIEAKSRLIHVDNGIGDPARPYSFLVDSFSDLIDAIYALKCIDVNRSIYDNDKLNKIHFWTDGPKHMNH